MPPKSRCWCCGLEVPKGVMSGPKKQLRSRLREHGWDFGGPRPGIVISGYIGMALSLLCPKCIENEGTL